MLNLIIWLAALVCPNPTHTVENHGNCTMMHVTVLTSANDTGGETGGIPKPPFPPPPPPPSEN